MKSQHAKPDIRKQCRKMFGDDWWDVEKAVKRQRQDDAILALNLCPNDETSSVDNDIKTLTIEFSKHLPTAIITSIEPVHQPTMIKCFDALKATTNAPSEQRWLYHGTSSDACSNIITKGFNRSYCGKNATVYGRGVYFARDMSYSASHIYSPPDSQGTKHMIAARVLIGKTAVGNDTMIEPPDGVTTTVNRAVDPSIFVVYKDFQAIPEYLIRFKVS